MVKYFCDKCGRESRELFSVQVHNASEASGAVFMGSATPYPPPKLCILCFTHDAVERCAGKYRHEGYLEGRSFAEPQPEVGQDSVNQAREADVPMATGKERRRK